MQDTQSIEAIMEEELGTVESAIARFLSQPDAGTQEDLHRQLTLCRNTIFGYLDERLLSSSAVRRWSQRLRDLTARVHELAPTEQVPALAV